MIERLASGIAWVFVGAASTLFAEGQTTKGGIVAVVGLAWAPVHAFALRRDSSERDRYREALKRIERGCGDDSRPEDNAVQIARDALAAFDASGRSRATTSAPGRKGGDS